MKTDKDKNKYKLKSRIAKFFYFLICNFIIFIILIFIPYIIEVTLKLIYYNCTFVQEFIEANEDNINYVEWILEDLSYYFESFVSVLVYNISKLLLYPYFGSALGLFIALFASFCVLIIDFVS
jgi:hypothetical protein